MPAPVSSQTHPVKNRHILLVEDDQMAHLLFRDALWIHQENEEYDVTTVNSIAEARALVFDRSFAPDLIVTGLSLPSTRADGTTARDIVPSLEFIRDIRAHFPHLPIVVYSRFGELEFQEKAKEAGASCYLVKGSLTPRELFDFISRL